MARLPPALAPWAGQLRLFAEPVADGLAPLLRPLERLLGPPGSESDADESGEPDGVAGLTRRGPPERLLPSEWLLAHELPEEFERRVVMGEQLFLKRREVNRRSGRCLALLLDAGPEQIGSPRLLHLALLILLARRAEATGARFRWGVLQRPEAPWHEGLARDNVSEGFLRAATLTPVPPEALSLWCNRLAENPAGEVWLAGSAAQEAHLRPALAPARLRYVAVDPIYDLGEPRLRVAVAAPRPAQEELPLPPAPVTRQALRHPFGPPVAAPRTGARTAAEGGIALAKGGHRVVVPLADGRLAMYTVPRRPGGESARPTFYTPAGGARVVAVQGYKRALMTLEFTGDILRSANIPDIKQLSLPLAGTTLALGDRPLPFAPFYVTWKDKQRVAYLLDDEQTLFRLEWNAGKQRAEPIARDVAAIGFTDPELVYARIDRAAGIFELRLTGSTESERVELKEPQSAQVLLDANGWDPRGWPGAFALHVGGGEWLMSGIDDRRITLRPPQGSRVIGALHTRIRDRGTIDEPDYGFCLAVLERDGRTITVLERSFQFSLPAADAPIRHATVSDLGGTIAWLSEAGTLTVFSMAHRQVLLRVSAP